PSRLTANTVIGGIIPCSPQFSTIACINLAFPITGSLSLATRPSAQATHANADCVSGNLLVSTGEMIAVRFVHLRGDHQATAHRRALVHALQFDRPRFFLSHARRCGKKSLKQDVYATPATLPD